MGAEDQSASELGFQLEKRLGRALRDAGWHVSPAARSGPGGPDLAVSKGQRRYLVELKVARESRRPQLLAMLAAALLESRVLSKKGSGRPLAVVGAPHISDAMAADLAAYAEEFAEGNGWGCIDARGRLALHGPGLDGVVAPEGGLFVVSQDRF